MAWARTSGPIGACINVLRAAGWKPIQPDHWIAPGPRAAFLNAPEPHADTDIVAAITADLNQLQWKEAAEHFMGRGLEQGPPTFEAHAAAKRILSKLADAEKDVEATPVADAPLLPSTVARLAALDAVEAGGATVGERYSTPQPCWRCGALHEDAFHRYFNCPANQCEHLRSMEPAIARTDFIGVSVAAEKGEFELSLWARGIIPASKSSLLGSETLPTPPREAGDFDGAIAASGRLYTDGSGGPKWATKVLRKV